MKNFLAYKQDTEVLPDTNRALLGSSMLVPRKIMDHRDLESYSLGGTPRCTFSWLCDLRQMAYIFLKK